MERHIEWFIALTCLIVGVSHIVRADVWIEGYALLHRQGRPGAFINGAMSLIPGAVVVVGHGDWSWPGAPLVAFGWLLLLKGAICFLAPDVALRSMQHGPSRAGFMIGGFLLLAIGGWAAYCVWIGR